ncbi:MAG: ATP-binding cassette domain-containing protein, partial [Planctomycetota bacterium]
MIELRDVYKTLGNKQVLRGMDLHVESGETFVIIGRSGIGKSVMLRHLVGLMKPDRGTVRVFGNELSSLQNGLLKEYRMKIGYLFQDGALLNWLTVHENVALPLREHRLLQEPELSQKVID